ncbi:neutral zinc metallopeptidase [Parasphingorhabdus pacifica]
MLIILAVVSGFFLLTMGAFGVATTTLLADGGGTTAENSPPHDTFAWETTSDQPTIPTTTDADGSTERSVEPGYETTGATETTQTAPGPQRVVAHGENPFNITGNGAVQTACDMPAFDTSVAGQDAFYQAVLPCLMEMWEPALRDANLPVVTPTVVTSGDDVQSPCGTRNWNQTAMYCPGNHTIYMTARYYADEEGRSRPGVYLGQFAHEFGHALQGMTGINAAYGNALYDVGGVGTPDGLELSRRSELQATCFEGMSLAALQNGGVSDDYIFPALQDSSLRGDEHNKQRDHGTEASNASWVEQGFYKNEIVECNTWLAEPSTVD